MERQYERLKEERKKLIAARSEMAPSRTAEIDEAKRVAATSRQHIEEIKSTSALKLEALKGKHEAERREDASKCAAFVKRIADDGKRISALEKERASLKASIAATQAEAAALAARRAAAAKAPETLAELLARLNLEAHLPALQEEELDLELLRSMDSAVLGNNMSELGMNAAEIARLSDELIRTRE